MERIFSEAQPDGDCLLFGLNQKQNYPQIAASTVKGKTRDMAYRVAYALYYDEDIEGVPIHHACAQPRCVNPKHLQRASNAENNLEMLARREYEAEIAKLKAKVAELEAQLK